MRLEFGSPTSILLWQRERTFVSRRVVPPPGMGLAQNGVHSAAG